MKIYEAINDPLIGPHQDQELKLMLRGEKPAALINTWEIDEWRPYIRQKKFVVKKIPIFGKNVAYVITLPTESWRANQLEHVYGLLKKADHDDKSKKNIEFLKKAHGMIGKLLGYSQEAIDKFLTNRFG